MKKVVTNIFLIIIILILCINLLSIFDIQFLGFRVFRIASGSMQPYLKVNDMVLIKKSNNYLIDDVVTYKENDVYVTHRIINKNKNKYTLKGDANNIPDTNKISKKQIVGKVIYKFKLITFNNTIKNIMFFISVFIIGLVITSFIPSKKQ